MRERKLEASMDRKRYAVRGSRDKISFSLSLMTVHKYIHQRLYDYVVKVISLCSNIYLIVTFMC